MFDTVNYPLPADSSLQIEFCFQEAGGVRCCKTDSVNGMTPTTGYYQLPKGIVFVDKHRVELIYRVPKLSS